MGEAFNCSGEVVSIMADFAFVRVLFEEIAKTEFIKCSEDVSEDIVEIFRMITIFKDLANCLLDKVRTVDQKELGQIKIKVKIEDLHSVEPVRVVQLKTEKCDEEYLESFPKKEIKKEKVKVDGAHPLQPEEPSSEDSHDDKAENKHEMESGILLIQNRLKSSFFLQNEMRCVDSRRRSAPIQVNPTLFYCDFCERKFPSEKILKRHFVTLHQKIYG